jgi:hypothetical protein
MKRIVLIVILVTGILQAAKSGPGNLYTNAYVYTCKGGSIVARVLNANSDLSAPQKAAARSALLDPNNADFGYLGIQASDILSEATYSYNCHAYAWHLTEGNSNKVWINAGTNASNLSTYWSNSYGCFVACTESDAEKIHYYTGDHSAVKSSVAGKYESKWGDFPVVRHSSTQVPYTSPGNRRYYRYSFATTPVTIYNFTNATFLVNFQHSNGYFKRMEIFPNSGANNTYVEPGQYESVNMYTTTTGGIDYVYTIERQGGGVQSQTNTDGGFYIEINSPTYIFIENVYSPVSFYPNPASNTLNIEIDAQAQSSASATTAGKQLKQEKSYDLRLYDGQGALLRQQKAKGGTVQFNVANLPDGIYYLHIYDGVNEKPKMRQIVVEH